MIKEPFYKRRDVSEKLNTTFDFIRENFKKVFLYVISATSVCCICFATIMLIAEIKMNYASTNYDTAPEQNSFFEQGYFIVILFFLTMTLVMPMAFTLISIYHNREGGLKGLKFKDIRTNYFINMAKWFIISFPMTIILLLLHLAFRNELGWFLPAVSYFLVIIFFEMAPPAFIIGQKGYGESIATSLNYAINHFLGTAGITITLLLVGAFVYLWEIGLIEFFTSFKTQLIGTDPASNIFAYIVYWVLIFAIFLALAASVALSLTAFAIGISYQYGSLEERKNLFSLKEKIKNFEQLKD